MLVLEYNKVEDYFAFLTGHVTKRQTFLDLARSGDKTLMIFSQRLLATELGDVLIMCKVPTDDAAKSLDGFKASLQSQGVDVLPGVLHPESWY